MNAHLGGDRNSDEVWQMEAPRCVLGALRAGETERTKSRNREVNKVAKVPQRRRELDDSRCNEASDASGTCLRKIRLR